MLFGMTVMVLATERTRKVSTLVKTVSGTQFRYIMLFLSQNNKQAEMCEQVNYYDAKARNYGFISSKYYTLLNVLARSHAVPRHCS